MTETLWRWYPAKGEWVFVTEATQDMKRKVSNRHKRHDAKGALYKWTKTGKAPGKPRAKKGEA